MTVLSQVKALVERWGSRIDKAPSGMVKAMLGVCVDEVAALLPAIEAQHEALEGMVWQFAYRGKRCLTTGGLSALEDAFDVLGWPDPYPTNEGFCDEPGCDEPASCGWPSPNGYRRTCGAHYPNEQLTGKPANGDST